jgi:hypothetical protein
MTAESQVFSSCILGSELMRKRVISPNRPSTAPGDQAWLNLDRLAEVEITSEEVTHPIEDALLPGAKAGWRAATSGEQSVRLIFDEPQQLTRIWLLFLEPDIERTQEFVVSWSPDGGRSFLEIVRQQWNFSPPASTREEEDYRVDLSGVTVLELTIVPDKSGGDARASVAQFRLA